MVDHLKKAAIAAFVVLLLCLPLIAYQTTDTQTGLALESRWSLVATLVAIGFAGQLAWSLLRGAPVSAAAGAMPGSEILKSLPKSILYLSRRTQCSEILKSM